MTGKSAQKHIYQQPGFFNQVICASLGSLSGIIASTGGTFSAVGIPSFERDENAPFIMGESEKAAFNSVLLLAMTFGPIVGPFMTTLEGPRTILLLLLLPIIASWLMLAFGDTIYVFFISRTILGMCGGISSSIGQIYLTEITSVEVRGFISSTGMLAQCWYAFIGSVAALFLSWRGLAVLNAVLMTVHLLLAFLFPESPTWLLRKSTEMKARRALTFLRGKENVEVELLDLQSRVAKSKVHSQKFLDLLDRKYAKALFVLFVIAALRQLSGAFVVFSYTVEIFESAGSRLSSTLSTVIISAVQLIVNFLSNGLTDRIGRKKLYVSSAILSGLSQTAFGAYYYQLHKNPAAAEKFHWVPLLTLILFSVAFSFGLASSIFVLRTELIPMNVRDSASTVMSVFNNFACFLTVQYYYSMRSSLTEAGVFWFYGAACIAVGIFCLLVLPETNGKSLDELEEAFAVKKPPKNDSEDELKSSEVRLDSEFVETADRSELELDASSEEFSSNEEELEEVMNAEVDDGNSNDSRCAAGSS